MTHRAVLSADFVRISREGVDPLSPKFDNPANRTPEFLAMDSSWPAVERVVSIAIIPNTNLIFNSPSFSRRVFFVQQKKPPLAQLVRRRVRKSGDTSVVMFEPWVEVARYTTTTNAVEGHIINRTELDHVEVGQLRGIPSLDAGYQQLSAKFDFIVVMVRP